MSYPHKMLGYKPFKALLVNCTRVVATILDPWNFDFLYCEGTKHINPTVFRVVHIHPIWPHQATRRIPRRPCRPAWWLRAQVVKMESPAVFFMVWCVWTPGRAGWICNALGILIFLMSKYPVWIKGKIWLDFRDHRFSTIFGMMILTDYCNLFGSKPKRG